VSLKKDKSIFNKVFTDGCRPSPEDKRDFTIETVALSALPLPKVFISSGMKVLNQGSVGSCVAHACATAMGYGELKSGMKIAHDFSRGFIYGNRKTTDHQGEGMYIRQALKQLNHCGDCQYAEFPYNENYPSVKKRIKDNKDKLFIAAQPYKILNYFRCYTEDEVKTALLNQGAVIISIPVYSSFAAECPMPSQNDKYQGGHAMTEERFADIIDWIVDMNV
jgi:C1A family cysteine protease